MSAPSTGFAAGETQPVVIVGGGFAGLTLALQLSRQTPRPPIVLVEPQPQFAFLPLLYELLSGELQAWEVAPRYDDLLQSSGIALIQDRVSTIHWQDHTVVTMGGQRLRYAQLVLATGSQPNDFGVPGVKEHALHFHSLNDVARLRQLVKSLNRPSGAGNDDPPPALAIVGAGPTGVELACKLADLLEGLRYTRDHAPIRQVLLLAGVANFFGRGILELMPECLDVLNIPVLRRIEIGRAHV